MQEVLLFLHTSCIRASLITQDLVFAKCLCGIHMMLLDPSVRVVGGPGPRGLHGAWNWRSPSDRPHPPKTSSVGSSRKCGDTAAQRGRGSTTTSRWVETLGGAQELVFPPEASLVRWHTVNWSELKSGCNFTHLRAKRRRAASCFLFPGGDQRRTSIPHAASCFFHKR